MVPSILYLFYLSSIGTTKESTKYGDKFFSIEDKLYFYLIKVNEDRCSITPPFYMLLNFVNINKLDKDNYSKLFSLSCLSNFYNDDKTFFNLRYINIILNEYFNLLYDANIILDISPDIISNISSLLYKSIQASFDLYKNIYSVCNSKDEINRDKLIDLQSEYLQCMAYYRDLYCALSDALSLSTSVNITALQSYIKDHDYSTDKIISEYSLYNISKKQLISCLEKFHGSFKGNRFTAKVSYQGVESNRRTNKYDTFRDMVEHYHRIVDNYIHASTEIHRKEIAGGTDLQGYEDQDFLDAIEYVYKHLDDDEDPLEKFSSFFEESYNMWVVYYLTSLPKLIEILNIPNLILDTNELSGLDDIESDDSKSEEVSSPAPKKRGRKKKIETSSESDTLSKTNSFTEESKPKKKPGRKKKVVIEDNIEDKSGEEQGFKHISDTENTNLSAEDINKDSGVIMESENIGESDVSTNSSIAQINLSSLVEDYSLDSVNLLDNVKLDDTKLDDTGGLTKINLTSSIGDYTLDDINILPKDRQEIPVVEEPITIETSIESSTDSDAKIITDTDTSTNPFEGLNIFGMEVKPLTFGNEEDIASIIGNVSYEDDEEEDVDTDDSIISKPSAEEAEDIDSKTDTSFPQAFSFGSPAVNISSDNKSLDDTPLESTVSNNSAAINIPVNSSNKEVTVHVNDGSKDMRINITFN